MVSLRARGVICSLLLATPRLHAQPSPARAVPRLIVLLTIDQLRADYIQRFSPQLTGGLAKLSHGGAWFTNAHHDHAITETAPGHATLLAGRFPRSTGIMTNRAGVEDDAYPLVAGGLGYGASPRRFAGTTLVDWLRAKDARSRALSVSVKDRAAILPIGRSKADVYWYSPDGRFVTSTYYRDSLPPWVTAFNARHLPQRFAEKSWTLLLPAGAYPEPDSVAVESGGVDFVFPHLLPDDSLDAASALRGTPFIDGITLAFALDGLQALSLGVDSSRTDVLSVSLSATDYIGHRYGPDSREMHDQILRVDRAVGTFLDSLYRLRDSATITLVLTGDHGAGTIPELATSVRPLPTRVTIVSQIQRLRADLRTAGVDTLAVDFDQQIIRADRDAFRRAGLDADSVLNVFAAAVRAIPGVARVDRFSTLLADTLTDAVARRWSHQIPASARVDLVITLTPYSLWGSIVASHGSPYDYDSHVPIIFFGAGVQPGRYDGFVRSVDIAPTLARLAGARPLERLDGVVLEAAIRP